MNDKIHDLFPFGQTFSKTDALFYIINNLNDNGVFDSQYRELAKKWLWEQTKVFRFIKKLTDENILNRNKIATENATKSQRLSVCLSEEYLYVLQQKRNKKRNRNATEIKPETGITQASPPPQTDIAPNSDSNQYEQPAQTQILTPYDQYLSLINETLGKKFRGNAKVKEKFNARLSDGYSLEDFKTAMRNIMSDDFHKESGFKYVTPEFFTRADKLDKWINSANLNYTGIKKKSMVENNMEEAAGALDILRQMRNNDSYNNNQLNPKDDGKGLFDNEGFIR